jgi:hypothetical protein
VPQPTVPLRAPKDVDAEHKDVTCYLRHCGSSLSKIHIKGQGVRNTVKVWGQNPGKGYFGSRKRDTFYTMFFKVK